MTFSQWEAQWPLDFGASLPRHSMGESGFDPRTWQRRGQRRGRSKKEVTLPAKGPQAAPGKQRVLCCLLAVSTASRSLHMVFPKPGTLFPQTASCCAPSFYSGLRECPHLLHSFPLPSRLPPCFVTTTWQNLSFVHFPSLA